VGVKLINQMNMNKLFWLLVISFLSYATFAQERSGFQIWKKNFKIDTTRIIDLSDQLGLYTYTTSSQNNLALKDLATNKKLKLQPNGQTNLGFGFNYKWIRLGAAFGLPFLNKDDEKYGETKRTDLQLNIFMRSLGIDTYFQKYRGFYLNNINDHIDSTYAFYPNLSDMETFALGLSAYYFFNSKKFSYKAAYTRNQIQKKSAGAFILGGFFNLYNAHSPNGFVPTELPDSIRDNYTLRRFETNIIGISIGYTYTLVFLKRLYINASFVPGIGLRFSEITRTDERDILAPVMTSSATLRFSLGYEGKHLYAGIKSITSINSYNYNTIEISSAIGNLQFYVGKRFQLKKKNKK